MTVATGYPDRLFGGAIRNEPAMTLDATTVAAAIALAILGIAWTGVALARRSGLRRLLRTLDGVSRGASLAMIAWHPRAGVLLWSEGAERLLGLERAQALGRPLPQGLAGLQRLGRDEVERHPLLLQRADGGSVKASVSWQDAPGQPGMRIATIEDLSVFRSEAEWAEASRVQRDALIREVHHRIKNSLQGVAGLLRQHLADKPLLRPLLESASSQVYAIAAVHGLQGEASGGAINLRMLVARVAASVSGIMHEPIVLSERCAALGGYIVNEEESVAVAIVLNELVMNAAKHRVRGTGAIGIDAALCEHGVELRIRNPGFLPPNFDLDAGSSIGNGLGLARSLLPRRGARIAVAEDGDQVLTTMTLLVPDVLNSQSMPREQRA